MESDHFWVSLSRQATNGTGYGLVFDLLVVATFFGLMQILAFQWPDLSRFKIKRKDYLDLRNRQVSIFHGLLGIFAGAYAYATKTHDCSAPSDNFEYSVITCSAGYFIYDFWCMVYFNLLDFDMALHHAMSISIWIGVLAVDRGGHIFVLSYGVSEIPNPAMHLRIVIKNMGLRYTRLYEVVEIFYFITFLFGRQLLFHPLFYTVMTCDEIFIVVRIASVGMLAQSWVFTFRMWASIKRRMAEMNERQRRGIKFHWLTPISDKQLEECDFYKETQKFKEGLH